MTTSHTIRTLGLGDVGLIAEIDRSERIETVYTVTEGELVERPASMTDLPPWDPVGTGPHSVAALISFCEPLLSDGAVFLGAFEGDTLCGVAVVDASFEPNRAWLALLHVTRLCRRQGVASALWAAAVAVAADANALYVSSASTESAVGFYLSRGCELADPVHPDLYAKEPDDIHLVCALPSRPGATRALHSGG